MVSRQIDGAARDVCSASECAYVYWNNPIPVVAALVIYHDKILLARNSRWPAGMFSLIAGYLEQGEAPEYAVVRELREELNLESQQQAFIGHYPLLANNQLIIAYALQAEGELRLNHEIAEIKLLTRDQLAAAPFENLPLTAAVVNDWLRLSR